MTCLIFVDCEAQGPSPFSGHLTQFGAVLYDEDADVTACAEHEFFGHLLTRGGEPLPEDRVEGLKDPYMNKAATAMKIKSRATRVMKEFYDWTQACAQGRGLPKFVSDNPAYDWQWIAYEFDRARLLNPYGHSARRLGDFYAGLVDNFLLTQQYKLLRLTKHDHNPIHDARGNAEAFHRLMQGERPPTSATKQQRKDFY
jgi:hypothetical protein